MIIASKFGKDFVILRKILYMGKFPRFINNDNNEHFLQLAQRVYRF